MILESACYCLLTIVVVVVIVVVDLVVAVLRLIDHVLALGLALIWDIVIVDAVLTTNGNESCGDESGDELDVEHCNDRAGKKAISWSVYAWMTYWGPRTLNLLNRLYGERR